MRSHRRERLAALTRGAALIGAGALAAACSKTPSPDGPTINAPPVINSPAPADASPAASSTSATSDATDAGAPAASDASLPRLPRVNAPPHPPYVNGPALPNKP